MSERTMGWVLLVAGAVLFYLCVWEGGGDEPFARKGTMVVPLCLVYGAAYAFFPMRARLLLGTRNKPTNLGWIVIAVLAVAGLGLYIALYEL